MNHKVIITDANQNSINQVITEEEQVSWSVKQIISINNDLKVIILFERIDNHGLA